MESGIKCKLHNRFDIFKKDARTGKEAQVAYAENIILNSLWSRLPSAFASYIIIGTGTGTLDPTRTTMFTRLANLSASSNSYNYLPDDRAWSRRMGATITETQYNGNYITEIGVGYDASNAPVTHALIRDMNGNPVSIEKTDTDIITFYATIYAVFPDEYLDSNRVHVIVPTVERSAFIDAMLGVVALPTGNFKFINMLDGCESSPSTDGFMTRPYRAAEIASGRAWNPSNKKLTFSPARIPVGSGNAATGIWGAWWTEGVYFNITDSPEWAGSFIEGEALGTGDGTTTDFKTEYSMISGTPVVKVNGVEDTNVTIDTNKPITNDLTRYLKVISTEYLRYLPGGTGSQGQVGTYNNKYCIVENPFYETYGISSIYMLTASIEVSNDLVNWTTALTRGSGTRAIPAEYRNHRYFRGNFEDSGPGGRWAEFLSADLTANELKNVHFVTPPAIGAAVTIDYTTKIVVKNTNYVFDFAAEITIGEYTEEY